MMEKESGSFTIRSHEVRRLYLVRHCHREDLVDGGISREWLRSADRPYDPGLSLSGARQAAALAERLRREPVDHLFSSPFLRAVATAHPIAEALSLSVRIEEGLGEWLNPNWFLHRPELLSPEALAARFPTIDTGYHSRVSRCFPEQDERNEAWPAIARTARALLAEFRGNLLLIGHGASLAGIIHGLVGQVPVDPGFGSVVRLVEENRVWVVHSYEVVPEG